MELTAHNHVIETWQLLIKPVRYQITFTTESTALHNQFTFS